MQKDKDLIVIRKEDLDEWDDEFPYELSFPLGNGKYKKEVIPTINLSEIERKTFTDSWMVGIGLTAFQQYALNQKLEDFLREVRGE